MKYFLSSNCALIQNKLFCVEAYCGLLVMINSDDGKVDCCDTSEGFISKKTRVVDFIESFDGKIYALDSSGDYLVIFDLSKCKCQYIWLGCAKDAKVNFSAFERCESYYYIFPKYGNKIMFFDIEKSKVTTGNYFNGIQEVQCACRIDNNVWILPKDAEKMYCYHLPDMEVDTYELGVVLKNCVHAVYCNGYIYILEKFGAIHKWNIEKALLQTITILEAKHDEQESMSRIVYARNKLIVLPGYAGDIKILNLLTKEAEIYNDYPEDFFYYGTNWLKYYGYCEDEEFFYFAMCAGNYMLMIKRETGELIWRKPVLDKLGEKVVRLLNNSGENLFHEGSLEIADLFGAERIDFTSGHEGDIGKAIYEKV